jgi:nicotinate dehydrogenase subunit A
MTDTTKLLVNGIRHAVAADPGTPLLYVLRNDLKLTGARFGCGLGQCGACTVLAGGRPVQSCTTPVAVAADLEITTIEGLGKADAPHPLQAAFVAEQAMQCGYCASGIIMSAAALLARNPDPTEAEVRSALDLHLCRCGAYGRMVKAVLRGAAAMRGLRQPASMLPGL